tara:strand:+ start:71589 stop:72413 length:825 start_codon:yes stop_codon:yes gene_type:complete
LESLESGWKGFGKLLENYFRIFSTQFFVILIDSNTDFMHKKLLLDAFGKVRKELEQEGVSSPSKTRCAEELSIIVSKSFSYSERRLRDFYNSAINPDCEKVNIPQEEVVLALANYLNYTDFKEYLAKNPINKEKEIPVISPTTQLQSSVGFLNKNKITLIAIFLLILGIGGYFYITRQRWMEWEDTHYVEVPFDSKKLNEGTLKFYKEERIENFKRIIANCSTQYFRKDGEVQIWYGKNKEGILQYFTSYGLHPETGKTLKPITTYMIRKYICP